MTNSADPDQLASSNPHCLQRQGIPLNQVAVSTLITCLICSMKRDLLGIRMSSNKLMKRNGLHQVKSCRRTCAKYTQIQNILHIYKVSSEPLLSIYTFCSIYWFCLQTVKALIRLSGCSTWMGLHYMHMPEDLFSLGMALMKTAEPSCSKLMMSLVNVLLKLWSLNMAYIH